MEVPDAARRDAQARRERGGKGGNPVIHVQLVQVASGCHVMAAVATSFTVHVNIVTLYSERVTHAGARSCST